jgi:hypothetical protein
MVVVEVVYPLPKTAGVALGEVWPKKLEERRSGADSISSAIVVSIRLSFGFDGAISPLA